MNVNFDKYHGTGNDFILIDNRAGLLPRVAPETYRLWCDRHFGVGADGIILLQGHEQYDFEMVYFNSDGKESSMCGNGGRCAVKFAHALGIGKEEVTFWAADGLHTAVVQADGNIALGMRSVDQLRAWKPEHWVLNTGSPHLVVFVPSADAIDLNREAPLLRHHPDFAPGGTNVNYAEILSDGMCKVRTFERGVEGETLSCGTGMVAVALAMHARAQPAAHITPAFTELITPGGNTRVSFVFQNGKYESVTLTGPAEFVFSGTLRY